MFSIVIPLFNNAHTIERALKSIINQTFIKYEIIVVDDGSIDNSIEKINKFTNDSRLKIISQKNQGASIARNTGVGKAQNKYIAFLDADDEWDPKYLETVHQAIKLNPNCGMVCCARYGKDNVTKNTNLIIAEKYKGKLLEINYFENPHIFSHTSSTVIEKNVFNQVGGFNKEQVTQEDLTLFALVALTKATIYCGLPLSYYYGNVEGQATSRVKGNYGRYIDACTRFNLTYKLWNLRGRDNKIFKIFLKYELRHYIIHALRLNDFNLIKVILENIDGDILNLFPFFEIKFYRMPSLKIWNKFYILTTKFFWRIRGFPRIKK